ncbi:Na+-dependent transporters of the SNF family [Fusobacterium necrophorum subsp. necrophorum]|nr:Na+-dependent transporters of the SNF family [Fusobacterium necrophorum subsp. necrophorum]
MERDFKKRDSFQNKIGFILACVGSAVGMGNIWLFPYRVGEFGGAAFLFPYLFFVLLLGLTGVSGEMAFGRAMKSGPLGAFRKALERRGKKYGDVLAFVPVLGSLGIAIGYAVVVAWILKYTVQSLQVFCMGWRIMSNYFPPLPQDIPLWVGILPLSFSVFSL